MTTPTKQEIETAFAASQSAGAVLLAVIAAMSASGNVDHVVLSAAKAVATAAHDKFWQLSHARLASF